MQTRQRLRVIDPWGGSARVDPAKRSELYRAEVEEARGSVARWMDHSEFPRVIAESSPGISDIVDQMERQAPELSLFDLGQIVLFTVASLGSQWAVVSPDGTIEQWPSSDWYRLSESDQRDVKRLCSDFAVALRRAAQGLHEAGAAIDPEAACDLVALAQLVVRPAVPVSAVDDLVLVGPSAFSRNGRALVDDRDGRGQRGITRSNQIRVDWRERWVGNETRRLGNRGGRPKGSNSPGSDTQQLRELLPKLLTDFPAMTPRSLRSEWRSSDPTTAGRQLRSLMGRSASDPAPGENSISTLR